jgi:hypothetical protein
MSWAIIPEFRLPDEPEALTYIAAVEAADGQALEPAVKLAINAFIKGCKNDGIWPAIKASCILAGARTLTGALVPLVGAAPTNNNFVAGDYNRKTGLVGNGSSKRLNTGINSSSLSENNNHLSCFCSSSNLSATSCLIGTQLTTSQNPITIATFSNQITMYASSVGREDLGASSSATGLQGLSRSVSTSFSFASGANFGSRTKASGQHQNGIISVFSSNLPNLYTTARLSFYSIGESLDLALLDTRVTALINAFDAAI